MKKHFKLKTVFKILGLLMGCCAGVTQAASFSDTFLMMNSENPTDHTVPGEVVILISFSIPLTSLQQWCDQAQKIQAPLVLRGLVNDSFVETQKMVKAMTEHCHGGVVIDPRLFEHYHITQVPAVIVREEINNKTCLPNQSCWQPEEDEVVMGDVGLESALKAIAQADNRVANIAQRKLAQWRAS